ncbi:MAG: murein biosynthesis integral membrane protein MurJ [Candidatus Omnitrophota bacterium]
MSTHKSILKSAGIVGFATLCSRILGFIRDMVIARLFGVYVYAQAFVIAFKIPNLLRDFIAEGAANAAIVPVLSEYALKRSKEDFWELANVILNLMLVVLTVLTIAGIIFAPFVVKIIAPGFVADQCKLATTITLTRILFPYLLLVGLAAYAMAVLNSLKHFSIPAFAPCLLNISLISFTLFFGEGIKGLSLGVLVGGCLQLAIQIPVLYRKGFRLKLFQNFTHPEALPIGKLLVPRLISNSIYQLNNFVDSIFGSLAWIVGDGGIAALYFAYRLILFPIGICSTSLSQVLLPTFSRYAVESDRKKLVQSLSFGLRATFFVMVPASVFFMVASRPIISTIFQGGSFDRYAVYMTADVLFFYSIGLCAYAATKILQSCFFALKDTSTPTKLSAVALVINIVLNALLMFPMKLSGIALATSLSGIVTSIILFLIIRKRISFFETRRVLVSFLKATVASLAMGLICFFVSRRMAFASTAMLTNFMHLGIVVATAGVSYIVFSFLLRAAEIEELWRWIAKKK